MGTVQQPMKQTLLINKTRQISAWFCFRQHCKCDGCFEMNGISYLHADCRTNEKENKLPVTVHFW